MKTNIKTITRKVISYCDIPQGLLDNHWLNDFPPDCYVLYNLDTNPLYTKTKLDEWLVSNYPKLINTTFFIHIDY